MKMQNDKLLPCPFCGGAKLKMDSKSTLVGYNGASERVERWTFSVRCNTCHARGSTVGGKVIPFMIYADVEHKGITTKEELQRRCVEAWNIRRPMERIVEQLEVLHELVNDNQKLAVSQATDIVRKGGVDNAG
jgi:Lar family restriction alleviation protein